MYLVYYTKENVELPTSLFTFFYTKQILELKIQQTHIKEIFEAYIIIKIYVSTKRFSNILCKNYIDYSGHLYQNLRHFWTSNELE